MVLLTPALIIPVLKRRLTPVRATFGARHTIMHDLIDSKSNHICIEIQSSLFLKGERWAKGPKINNKAIIKVHDTLNPFWDIIEHGMEKL